MSCDKHENHQHEHSLACGHTAIRHGDHIDYVHDGHLHHKHNGHWDECSIDVSEQNPADCVPVESACEHHDDCGHELVPHGDHYDYVVHGRLHHVHGDHVDDHGPVDIVK